MAMRLSAGFGNGLQRASEHRPGERSNATAPKAAIH